MPDNEAIAVGQAMQTHWTVQAFAEIEDKPWIALQEHGPDGRIERQYTGYAEEVHELANSLHIKPQVLPRTSEENFYTNLPNGTREYELGRQFAADSSRLMPQELEPLGFKRFTEGVQARQAEDSLRTEHGSAHEKHRSSDQAENIAAVAVQVVTAQQPRQQKEQQQTDSPAIGFSV